MISHIEPLSPFYNLGVGDSKGGIRPYTSLRQESHGTMNEYRDVTLKTSRPIIGNDKMGFPKPTYRKGIDTGR